MPPCFTPQQRELVRPFLRRPFLLYDANRRFCAASIRLLSPREQARRNELPESRSFSISDVLALAFAAVILAVFELLHRAEFPLAGRRFLTALAITAAFALMAWLAGGVSLSGALAGSAVAFIMAIRDLRMFLALIVVFALTLAATRVGYTRKQQLRTAEPAGGRTAAQAMANLGMAALVVAIAPANWPTLALAALAEAAGDTSSSEIGMAFPGRTLLITSFRPTPAGTDGGISLFGTIAACAGVVAIAASALVARLVTPKQAAVIALAGFLGTLVDSLLGSLFERRGWLDNDLVNLLSTVAAVGVAWVLA
jgi:uncharacterized protein (TIGR00297 family)